MRKSKKLLFLLKKLFLELFKININVTVKFILNKSLEIIITINKKWF